MGLFNPPPTNGSGSLPDIPVADFVAQGAQMTTGQLSAGYWEDLIAKWWAAFMKGVTVAVSFLVGGMDDILANLVKIVAAAQGTNQPGFFAMIAAVLQDLLGVPFDPAVIQASFQKRGSLSAMATIGGDIYDTLAKEFSSGQAAGSITATTSPAKAFLGFLTSFAVRQGNVAVISELIPQEFNFMGGLREYGSILARNLGLGRMARQALHPLIQTLIADPLQMSINAQYRPKQLTPQEAFKAWFRGYMTQSQLTDLLISNGYSDPNINFLISDSVPLFPAGDSYEIIKTNAAFEDRAISQFQYQGYSAADAQLMWGAEKQRQIDSLVREYLGELRTMYRQGAIDISSVSANLDALPLTQDERTWWLKIISQAGMTKTRHLSESELERAYLEGVIDLSTIQNTWTNLGYQPDSVTILTLLLLQKQVSGTKTTTAHVARKHLTEAQLEKGYNNGILDLAQLQAGWTNLGYSAADIQVLTALVGIKTVPPGSTTLPGLTTP